MSDKPDFLKDLPESLRGFSFLSDPEFPRTMRLVRRVTCPYCKAAPNEACKGPEFTASRWRQFYDGHQVRLDKLNALSELERKMLEATDNE